MAGLDDAHGSDPGNTATYIITSDQRKLTKLTPLEEKMAFILTRNVT